MVPGHAAVCAFDQSTGPDTLFVSDADAIRSVFDLEAVADKHEGVRRQGPGPFHGHESVQAQGGQADAAGAHRERAP